MIEIDEQITEALTNADRESYPRLMRKARDRIHELEDKLACKAMSKCAHCPSEAVINITLGDPINYSLCQRCADIEAHVHDDCDLTAFLNHSGGGEVEKAGWNAFYRLRKSIAEGRYPGMTEEIRSVGDKCLI